jgi:hypothetical protein
MSKRDSKPKLVSRRILKNPWPIVAGILFCLLLALTLFFLFSGISPEIENDISGSIGISMLTNSKGEVVLYPTPGLGAQKAGVENFDILLKINGQPASTTANINKQLRGRVGEQLTIIVRKSDGSEKSYTIVRTFEYQDILDEAKLSVGALAAFYVILSLLVGLGFAALGAFLLLRRASYVQFILTAFVLVLLPYSLNSVSVIVQGVTLAHLEWLYNLLRVAGLFLATVLVFVFPNGQFVPQWIRWGLIGVAVWAVLYCIALINPNFLPGSWIDLVWIVIIALGLALQIYRYQRISTETERRQTLPMGIALLVALAVYVVVWLLQPSDPFSSAGWLWFSMMAELLVDAGFLFLGVSLMLSARKAE